MADFDRSEIIDTENEGENRSKPHRGRVELLAPNGKVYPSIQAMCRDYGVKYVTYRRRLSMGATVAEALMTPEELREWRKMVKGEVTTPKTKRDTSVTDPTSGVVYPSFAAMCKAHGLDGNVVRARVRTGWTLTKALTKLRRPNGRKEWKAPSGMIYPSFRAMCAAEGVREASVKRYVNKGYSLEMAMEIERRNLAEDIQRERKPKAVSDQGEGQGGLNAATEDPGELRKEIVPTEQTKTEQALTTEEPKVEEPKAEEPKAEDKTAVPERELVEKANDPRKSRQELKVETLEKTKSMSEGYRDYLRTYGYIPVIGSVRPTERNLAVWASRMRRDAERGNLDTARADIILDISPSVLEYKGPHHMREVPSDYWVNPSDFGSTLDGLSGVKALIPQAEEVKEALSSIYNTNQLSKTLKDAKANCKWSTRVVGLPNPTGMIARNSLGFTAEIMRCVDPTSDALSVGLLTALDLVPGGLAEVCFSKDIARFQIGGRVKRAVSLLSQNYQLAILCAAVAPRKYCDVMCALGLSPELTWEMVEKQVKHEEWFRESILKGTIFPEFEGNTRLTARCGLLISRDVNTAHNKLHNRLCSIQGVLNAREEQH